MHAQTLLSRTVLGAALALLELAAFGELRPGAAAFLMLSVVLAGAARDVTSYRSHARSGVVSHIGREPGPGREA
jgi:hypothetical protein